MQTRTKSNRKKAGAKITTENLQFLVWQKRQTSVTAFACGIVKRKSSETAARATIYRAVKYPQQYPGIFQKITEALSE